MTWGLFVNHGTRDEIPETNGISHFLEHVIFRAQYRRSHGITELLRRGAVVEAVTTKEYTQYSVTTVPADATAALRALGQLLTDPEFSAEIVEEERGIIGEELRRYRASGRIIDDILENALFGNRSIGLPTLGTEENLAAFNHNHLQERYRRYYVPVRCVAVGVGPIDGAEAVDMVDSVLGMWEAQSFMVPTPTFEERPKIFGVPGDSSRVVLRMGFRGPGLSSPDRAVMTLLADGLGLSMGSRLWNALRGEKPLAYDVQAIPVSYGPAGYVKIQLSCERRNVAEIIDRVLAEVAKLHEGLREEELEQWVTLRSTALLREVDDPRRMLPMVGRFAVNGMMFLVDSEIHRYRQVTPEATMRVAREYLTGDCFGLVAFGLGTEELFEMVA